MRPITCYLSDDGTVFLPVVTATEIRTFCGHDKAYRACQEHEAKLKTDKQTTAL